MPDYILSLDQGTTSSRAIIFNRLGGIVAVSQKEFEQIYPKPGWVEHDPEQIFKSVVDCLDEVIKRNNLTAHNVKAIGITN